MKIEVQTKKLKESISLVEKISGKHATLPVLSCILFEAKKGEVVLRATNLDIGIEVTIPAKVDGEGVVAIPASVVSAFISQLPDQNPTITLELSSNNILITSAKSKCTIKTVSSEDFPSIPRVTEDATSLPTELFIKGLRSVWYSASVSSVKPELSSVYVYRDEESIVFAATDSFRLAERKIKILQSLHINDILIPFKNISDLVRTLEVVGGTSNVRVNKNLISFESKGVYIVSRVTDGVFPDYRQIIPKSFVTEAVFLKQDILNSLKISNIFSDKFNQIRLIVDPKNNILEIQTKNSDIGENNTTIDAALTGDRVEINFNCKYIADCFQSIEADSVSFQISGPNRPMVIRPVSGDQTFMYLAMPMNR
jgi:DNA polymerase III subunit beta